MKKIKYGRNSTGSYCYLYGKILWFYVLDTIWGTSSHDINRAQQQAYSWQEQYSIPDDFVVRKDI